MKKLLPLLKLLIAAGIITFLIYKIHNETWLYNFTITNGEPSLNTIYSFEYPKLPEDSSQVDSESTTIITTIFIPYSIDKNNFKTFCYDKNSIIPDTGILTSQNDAHPPLVWNKVTKHRSGLQALKVAISKAFQNKLMFFLSISLFSICLLCIISRWKIILDGLGISIGWKKISSIFLIGQFFNFFMIGATGGDIVKAIYIARETDKKTEVVSSVFIDRFIGLFALISLTAIILLSNYQFYMQFNETQYVFWFIQAIFAAFIMIILSIICAKPLIDFIVNKLPGKHKFIAIIDTIYEATRFCFTNKSVAVKTLALSYTNHIAAIFMMLFAGKALGVTIPNQAYFLIAPLINAIGSIPVTPGGLGMREIAAVTFFGLLNVSVPSAFFLSFFTYFAGMIWSLPGVIFYIRTKK
ncbi:MAG: lysylphosphatidylglycerol synthase transmembrane domain-containing protein [Kiritimatiellae bacterium]|jgi:uncharacterized protein (TIRG00374 family)|nr:lysylphosphatidylglycerol synthase transmembrane domain-containing protein [Kiritimatiellia bacterium]